MKYIIVGMLFFILFSLGTALFTMVKDRGQGTRTVKALTMRISLSLGLIVLLMLGYAAGFITPNSSF
jgi:hypothetical protein